MDCQTGQMMRVGQSGQSCQQGRGGEKHRSAKPPQRDLRGLVMLVAALLAGVISSATPLSCWAQDEQASESKASSAAAHVTLDMARLLRSERVFEESVEGPVWHIEAGAGRRLIQLPVLVEPQKQSFELDKSPVEVRGGRFVAWQVAPDPDSRSREQRQGEAQSNSKLPVGAPIFTRKLTVLPSGHIHWELERVIPAAVVQEEEQDYRLKLRPQRFLEMEPEEPEVTRRNNEDPREYQERRRLAISKYRAESRQFMGHRRRVLDLPDEFEAPLPRPMWGIHEVLSSYDELTFTGDLASLPWTISLSDLQMLRNYAQPEDQRRDKTGNRTAQVRRMQEMTATGHPLTFRLIAEALHQAGTVSSVQIGDPLHTLAQTIIHGPDEVARQRVLGDLASHRPAQFCRPQPDAQRRQSHGPDHAPAAAAQFAQLVSR